MQIVIKCNRESPDGNDAIIASLVGPVNDEAVVVLFPGAVKYAKGGHVGRAFHLSGPSHFKFSRNSCDAAGYVCTHYQRAEMLPSSGRWQAAE